MLIVEWDNGRDRVRQYGVGMVRGSLGLEVDVG